MVVLAAGFFLGTPLFSTESSSEWRQQVTELARPLSGPGDLDALVEAAGERRLVLLGEASHGTREFYTWRDQISRRLIEEKDFSFIAVEGDWAMLQALNRYVRGEGQAESEGSAREVLLSFDRWPNWLWANEEILELADWLREFNESRPADKRIGFHGLDLYGPWDSIREVIGFFESIGEDEAREVRELYAPWARYDGDGRAYARAVFALQPTAEEEVAQVVGKLRELRPDDDSPEKAAWFEAKQNAKVVKNAELHFRSMVNQGPENWNARASHMQRTTDRLLTFYGPESRGIVWAHNTHVGDARATSMGTQGRVNIGHLARESLGREAVFIVGFGSYQGTVVAGREWDSPATVMDVPPAPEDSVEGLLHGAVENDFWMLFDDSSREGILTEARGHRAIGVTYHPEMDHQANYVPTILTHRYDAFLYLRKTEALTPLD